METTKHCDQELLELEDPSELNFAVIDNYVTNDAGDLPISSNINKNDELIQIYLNDIGKLPLLTATEEVHYSRLAKKGDLNARNYMVKCNLRLVVTIAGKYVNRGLTILDLIEEGNLGLLHAVKKFDPERGFRFSTYATYWIQQAINRAIMNKGRTIRLPIHVIKELHSYLKTAKEIAKKLDREPSFEDIAKELNINPQKVNDLLCVSEIPLSLDPQLRNNDDKVLLEVLPNHNSYDPEKELENNSTKEYLNNCLSMLNEKQRTVLTKRFGLVDGIDATLKEIASGIGVTVERVRQIETKALEKLRVILEKNYASVKIKNRLRF